VILVFEKEDYDGFKLVGEGSKKENKGTIGQFGRGAQTMYHWTDVPIILSGRHLLILE
jgi:sacsin